MKTGIWRAPHYQWEPHWHILDYLRAYKEPQLSIVLAINGIYTKHGIFGHRPSCRLSIIGPIVAVSRLSFASVYSTICTKSAVIAYKNSYKQPEI